LVSIRDDLGGSGTISEITEAVATRVGLTEDQQALPRAQGRNELEYRLAWARTKLKLLKLLDNSRTGVWSTTDLAHHVNSGAEVDQRYKAYVIARKTEAKAVNVGEPDTGDGEDSGATADDSGDLDTWRDQLLQAFGGCSPLPSSAWPKG